jgi:spermidine/putrescine transport system ATP-binding protein
MSGSAKDVKLADVSKAFGTTQAVHPLSLHVHAGEFLTLLGPSGCGKTTLLRLIAGLEQVSGGVIKVGSEDVTDAPPNRRDTSIMFQDYALFPHKSLIDNIAYGLKMRGVPKRDRDAQAAAWLETIELSGFGQRLPHQLSGGQRQRVALARSLIVEPGVLLLDEPLGALDANLRRQMQLELRRVHRDIGLTFIYVTHDQEEALTMSDRIAVMRDGRIEQLGTPTQIYDHPETEFVARFIGQCNVLEAEVTAVSTYSITCQTAGLAPLTVTESGAGSPAKGERIAVALRPEAIRLAKGAVTPAKNGALVHVEDVTFVGSSLKVSARTSSGKVLDVDLNRRDVGTRTPEPGQDITVAWDAKAATLLRRSPDQV